jgi:hypothetical protein
VAEFEARFERLLEPLLLTVRFDGEVNKAIRSNIFERFVNITPAMDLPYVSPTACLAYLNYSYSLPLLGVALPTMLCVALT